jgi:hypothetical protein
MEAIRPYIALIVPLLIIQVTLMVIALLDLRKQVKTRGPRQLWLLVIIFVNLIGPILYFVVGKEDD